MVWGLRRKEAERKRMISNTFEIFACFAAVLANGVWEWRKTFFEFVIFCPLCGRIFNCDLMGSGDIVATPSRGTIP